MSQVQQSVPCSKCGRPIVLPVGVIVPEGTTLEHPGECPRALYRYRARIIVDRIEDHQTFEEDEPTVLAMSGKTIDAYSFGQALDVLNAGLAENWQRVLEVADIAESDLKETTNAE